MISPLVVVVGIVTAAFSLHSSEALVTNRVPQRPALPSDCFSLLDAHNNGIDIRKTKTKGLGAIKAGDWIGEYKGEILTRAQVEARYWDKRKCQTADRRWKKSRKQRRQGLSGDYLFDMGDDLFLDAEDTDVGSWCRFMNHANERDDNGDQEISYSRICNVETKCSRLSSCEKDGNNGQEETVMPRLWFIARRDIAVGEELLYDYGDDYWID
ncbi:MAG: hypothetical protein SGARI_006967 [Bacillariaceae sp.]